MNNIIEKLSAINWQTVTEQMNEKGFVVVPKLLSNEDCERLVGNYNQSNLYRKTITMDIALVWESINISIIHCLT